MSSADPETRTTLPPSPETITIQPGPKLTVTLPSPQTGYTLTADKVELSWHDSLKLTLTVAEGYYKTASFAVKAGNLDPHRGERDLCPDRCGRERGHHPGGGGKGREGPQPVAAKLDLWPGSLPGNGKP